VKIQNSQSAFPIQKKEPSRFVVRHQEWQATKKYPIYIHIPGGRQPLVRSFLGGGLDSPREEEGLVAMVANGSRAC
jgi:hypothetical protein